ncbi:MAG: GumC family protein [Candidatus Cyclobacteriaceae bacterium M3_2C_046]
MKDQYYSNNDKFQNNEEESFAGIKKILHTLWRKWYIVAISIILALIGAYVYTHNTQPVYQVQSSILVKDPQKVNNTISDLLYGDKLGNPRKSGNNLQNTAFMLKKYSLVKNTLHDLGLNVFYFVDDDFQMEPIHESRPINVEVDTSATNVPEGMFKCFIRNSQYFRLTTENEELNTVIQDTVFRFGQNININGYTFRVNLVNNYFDLKYKEVYFLFNDINKLADFYVASMNVSPIEESSIIQISLEGSNPTQEVEFLNQLMKNYLQYGMQEKTFNAAKTIEFIDNQLNHISDSLGTIESRLENFKTRNTIDLSNEARDLYDQIQQLEKDKSTISIKNKYLNHLQADLQKENIRLEEIVVPSSMGVNDNVINSLVQKLIDLQLEKKTIKNSDNPNNPVARKINIKIESLKDNIVQNVKSIQSANNIRLRDINRNIGQHSANLETLPVAEREFVNIQRQHNLSETLYLFLQQKRAEAGIAKASTNSDIKIVNEARVKNGGHPIKPNPMINYATAFLLGLLIPTAFFYVSDQFNNKIQNEDELINQTSIPILGLVGHEKQHRLLIHQDPYSPQAESFRTIRTNLRYLTESEQEGGCQTYMITSSISGEGKTFCAKNLAFIFAISGKKTLYINTDMRKQNTYDEFELRDNTGLSSYMAGMVEEEVIIHPTNTDNLYLLPSGNIPPNPSELLLKDQFRILINRLKKEFDYIIMDTPPIGIISDAMEISKYSDVDILIVRQNYTLKQDLTYGNQIYKNRKHNKMAIIFNDVKNDKLSYRYKGYYGYSKSYDQEMV